MPTAECAQGAREGARLLIQRDAGDGIYLGYDDTDESVLPEPGDQSAGHALGAADMQHDQVLVRRLGDDSRTGQVGEVTGWPREDCVMVRWQRAGASGPGYPVEEQMGELTPLRRRPE